MDPKNEPYAFSISSNVLLSLTSLIFGFLSFLLGVINKRVLSLGILVLCSLLDTFIQLCGMNVFYHDQFANFKFEVIAHLMVYVLISLCCWHGSSIFLWSCSITILSSFVP